MARLVNPAEDVLAAVGGYNNARFFVGAIYYFYFSGEALAEYTNGSWLVPYSAFDQSIILELALSLQKVNALTIRGDLRNPAVKRDTIKKIFAILSWAIEQSPPPAPSTVPDEILLEEQRQAMEKAFEKGKAIGKVITDYQEDRDKAKALDEARRKEAEDAAKKAATEEEERRKAEVESAKQIGPQPSPGTPGAPGTQPSPPGGPPTAPSGGTGATPLPTATTELVSSNLASALNTLGLSATERQNTASVIEKGNIAANIGLGIATQLEAVPLGRSLTSEDLQRSTEITRTHLEPLLQTLSSADTQILIDRIVGTVVPQAHVIRTLNEVSNNPEIVVVTTPLPPNAASPTQQTPSQKINTRLDSALSIFPTSVVTDTVQKEAAGLPTSAQNQANIASAVSRVTLNSQLRQAVADGLSLEALSGLSANNPQVRNFYAELAAQIKVANDMGIVAPKTQLPLMEVKGYEVINGQTYLLVEERVSDTVTKVHRVLANPSSRPTPPGTEQSGNMTVIGPQRLPAGVEGKIEAHKLTHPATPSKGKPGSASATSQKSTTAYNVISSPASQLAREKLLNSYSLLSSPSGQMLLRVSRTPVGRTTIRFANQFRRQVVRPTSLAGNRLYAATLGKIITPIKTALAKSALGKIVKKGVETLGKAIVTKVVPKLATALAGPIGTAIAVVWTVADVIKGLLSGDVAQLLKQLFNWIADNPWVIGIMALGAIAAGGPAGAILGGLAALATIGLIAAGGLGTLGLMLGPFGLAVGGTVAFIISSTLVSLAIGLGIFIATWLGLTAFYEIFIIPQGFMSNVPASQMEALVTNQTEYAQNFFSITKTASPSQFANSDFTPPPQGSPPEVKIKSQTVTYTVTINASDPNIKIENAVINDTMTLIKSDNGSVNLKPLLSPDTSMPNYLFTYPPDPHFVIDTSFLISNNLQASDLTNSAIINTVTVVANVSNAQTGQVIQNVSQSASATVTIGNHVFVDPRGWPVWGSGMCVTQGPGGKYSHANANAIDIATNGQNGFPVYSTMTGTIVYPPYSSIYGYYAVVTSLDHKYTAIFGHLKPDRPVAGSSQVTPSTIIGYSDNSGNSSGPHVHYELKIADNSKVGSIDQYVPCNNIPAGTSELCAVYKVTDRYTCNKQ